MTTRCAERAAATALPDGGEALVRVGDGGDVEAHRVDAHRGEPLGVVPHAGQRLGVDRARRVGQRAGGDDGSAHDEAVSERVLDVGAAHRERRVRTGREHLCLRGDRQSDERYRGRDQELLPHTTHVSHRPGQIPHESEGSFYAACVRIVSLVPSATEIIAALGLADSLVGRSHECNYPAEVDAVPVVSASRIDTTSIASAEIDRAVRDALADGRPLYAVDAELLERLAPDLIVTQDLCEVCAVPSGEVRRVAHVDVETLSLDPRDLGEIEESIRTLARHLGVAATGRAAGPGDAPPHRRRAPGGARPAAAARVRRRVARPALRRRPLGAGDGRARGRRGGARPRARALVRDDLGRRRGGGTAAARARAVRLRPRAHRERGGRRAGDGRPRRGGRRRRGLFAPRPARRRGRRAARAPPASRGGRSAAAAVAPVDSRRSSYLRCSRR